jgi:hypothetical protein
VIDVLLITGSMGAGKTTVLNEASDILTAREIAHAAIDLDALGLAHLPGGRPLDLMLQNLAAIWANYAVAGISRVLLAGAVETLDELERIGHAIPGCRIVVGRLTAPVTVMQERVATRERGIQADTYVSRVPVLEALLDLARLEDFSVPNDGAPLTMVARELLQRAAWI